MPALDLGLFALGQTFLTIGVAVLLLVALQQSRPRDRRADAHLLAPFAAFALLYGLRLWTVIASVRQALPLDSAAWDAAYAWLTYAVPAPAAMFLSRLLGGNWPPALRRLFQLPWAALAGGVLADLILRSPGHWNLGNSLMVMAGVAALLLGLRWPPAWLPREKWALTLGLGGFAAAILFTNLAAVGILSPGLGGGFAFLEGPFILLFAVAMGYVALARTYDEQAQLRRMRDELALARKIQGTLVPAELPRVPSLQIEADYEPMHEVAGDFYDWVSPTPLSVTILVADVSGHGVPAALLASAVKVAFRAQQGQWHHPAKVLAGMNAILKGLVKGPYVTAACLHVNRETREGFYSGAGHPPGWQIGPLGTRTPLDSNGLPLGLFAGLEFQNQVFRLAAGDRFYLCTDGVLEAENAAGEVFQPAYERLVERRCSVTAIRDQLLAWQGNAAQDDRTLLMIEFR
jgi:sigma-B regulation protein RsbU (phosphoserine phosphatase)